MVVRIWLMYSSFAKALVLLLNRHTSYFLFILCYSFYFVFQGFYLYLYLGSIAFLIYVYLFLLRTRNPNSFIRQVLKRVGSVANSIGTLEPGTPAPNKRRYNDAAANCCGSFYLRLGALGKNLHMILDTDCLYKVNLKDLVSS